MGSDDEELQQHDLQRVSFIDSLSTLTSNAFSKLAALAARSVHAAQSQRISLPRDEFTYDADIRIAVQPRSPTAQDKVTRGGS